MSRNTPTNSDDIIDGAELLDRLEELRDARRALQDAIDEAVENNNEPDDNAYVNNAAVDNANAAMTDWLDDNGDELAALEAIENEFSRSDTLIRESYFEDYARELAEETIGRSKLSTWPLSCIDWKQAAEELQVDYGSLEFDGVTYLVRS